MFPYLYSCCIGLYNVSEKLLHVYCPKSGDVNNDGNINAVDASRVLKAYAMKATGQDMGLTDEHIESADVNGDGKVDAVDASIILSYYAYKYTGGLDPFDVYLKNR